MVPVFAVAPTNAFHWSACVWLASVTIMSFHADASVVTHTHTHTHPCTLWQYRCKPYFLLSPQRNKLPLSCMYVVCAFVLFCASEIQIQSFIWDPHALTDRCLPLHSAGGVCNRLCVCVCLKLRFFCAASMGHLCVWVCLCKLTAVLWFIRMLDMSLGAQDAWHRVCVFSVYLY